MKFVIAGILVVLLFHTISSERRETRLMEQLNNLQGRLAHTTEMPKPREQTDPSAQPETEQQPQRKWNVCWASDGCEEMDHARALQLRSTPMSPAAEVAWHAGVRRLEYKILKTDGLDEKGRCNGFIIDESKRLVLTALHCLPPYRDFLKQKNTVTFGGVPALLVAELPDAELALFQIEQIPSQMKGLQYEEAVIGEQVWARSIQQHPLFDANSTQTVPNTLIFEGPITFSGGVEAKGRISVLTVMTGKGVQRPSIDAIPTDHEVIRLSGEVEAGFSGGPIFNKEGRVVGIVSSGGGGETYAISSKTFAAILQKYKK